MHSDDANTRLELVEGPIDVGELYSWALDEAAGAVVLFSGTTRNFAPGRPDVKRLEYEAYNEQVIPRFEAIAAKTRLRWPELLRLGIVHRTGIVELKDSSVVIVASSPHRGDAFEAARFGIDALKKSVPIWKRETWSGGSDWGSAASDITEVANIHGEESENTT
ncbi:MAG: molybdenum cofactor biosynthesis protein MoaE [Acidimicrobiales bacterium]